ncbi:MotE family protein [Lederbergia wuyishanensis]|uniref:Flagellar motility protein MotE (MotC chaperone) n=1 Tax=Lederbergia wuyishanensis TaxID=1347903 RepID=A0ABU0CZQ5_9BACI|nr:hypothetical protein [Lederbergia wuyishanensis]MCJ8006266.1 hypothetical protein [Lederbergia wuyishanensis]MDQ0341635.1 flagellar motility protein MotE (MotC chaperone) [Lederbergia wuyishanensis]
MEKTLKNQKTEKEPGIFHRFIFWFIIPLLFALFLALLIASVAGVNVFQKAKEFSDNVPILSNMFDEKEKANVLEYEEKIVNLDAEIQNKNAQIDQLKSQLEKNENEKERFLLEKQRLEQTIDELMQMRDENKRAFKEIVTTYEAMAPKNAAPIILEMNDEEAVKILSNIGTESLAKILEKMPPEKAAKYLEKLAAKTE